MNFDMYCQDVARNFIQSVMVVDDQADLSGAVIIRESPEVIIPKNRAMAFQDSLLSAQADPSTPPAETEQGEVSHALDGMRLTRSFAKLGVACSIYRPELVEGDEEIADTVKVARHADVVVLDWRLGADSSKAREIVRRILDQDARENGRLRLIAIYTGEVGLDSLRAQLERQLKDAGIQIESTGPDGPVALTRKSLRIVFINKAHAGTALGETGIAEADLPDRLVAEFAEMSRGIMPAIALGSIAAIRNASHHVLAKFHSGLDGTLATHRALQHNPEDAQGYVADLVGEEIRAILEVTEVGAKHAGIEVFESWVTYQHDAGLKFNVKPDAENSLGTSEATAFLAKGVAGHEAVKKSLAIGAKRFPDDTASIFHRDKAAADVANREFSRMAALKREAYGSSLLPSGWLPTLTLGSIVVQLEPPGGVFACIQPVCDAVRIVEPRRFPLVPLNEPTEKLPGFSLVIRFKDKSEKVYDPDYHPYNLYQVTFSPSTGSDTVKAVFENDRYLFTAADGRHFEWLATLKGFVALRLIQRSAGQVDRVGLDEYEWLRGKANKSGG